MPAPEAEIRETEEGREPATEGWFVINVSEARGESWAPFGRGLPLESRDAPFRDYGFGIHILEPGESNGLYHEESNQEDFLVLHGECLVLIEEQERRLKQWDFVHCPAGTRHIFVGAGDGPSAILMAGARDPDRTLHYPVSELAARHGASARESTDWASEAYAPFDREFRPVRIPWPL